MVMTGNDPGLYLYSEQINANCTQTTHMVRSIFIIRTKSLWYAGNSSGLFADDGHGRGWPDPTIPAGEIGPTGQGRGKSSEQIFKKKRASRKEMTVSYNILETVDTVNTVSCEIIETVMILLLPRSRPPTTVRCHVQLKIETPKFFRKTKKALLKTVRSACVVQ